MKKLNVIVPAMLALLFIAEPALAAKLCEGLDLPAAAQAQLAAWTVLVNTLYNLDITKTRE